MDLPDLIREAIATDGCASRSAAREAARRSPAPVAVSRVHSFLVRYCMGNLAASQVLFERRDLRAHRPSTTPREFIPHPRSSADDRREATRGDPVLPGESDS